MIAIKRNKQIQVAASRALQSLLNNVTKESSNVNTNLVSAKTVSTYSGLLNQNNRLLRINKEFSTSVLKCQEATDQPKPPSSPLFYIEEHKDKGFLVLKLNKAPVNSLNLEFLTELNIQLEKIEQNKEFTGVILTSNLANIFSAGLDILEMYQIKADRGRQFWNALQEFWIKLYGSSKVYIAAINGHSPAGGCLMALSCDYRIMAKGPYKIGLNETLLGIKAPFWFRDTMINVIGNRESEKALQLGKMYKSEEALAINLVDEIVEPAELMQVAEQRMQEWCRIPTVARELTKASMRRETLSKLIAQRESDIEAFIDFTSKDFIQKSLKGYLDSLKKPKK